eukprot:NODE_11097_length_1308_cov_4.927180.p1 GENE.NODE_11097_length_1308_cov_4.927180~~NODE_11097_length_1308_cov_4.927180.p1  ORF type:complete len:270 (-),score=93.94 NODE_11097_length_1308_cov_4.927180:299-1108(-)
MCGAGSAGMGICAFIVESMAAHGLSYQQAYQRFHILDQDGLITATRGGVDPAVAPFAAARRDLTDGVGLMSVLRHARPTALMGASTVGGLFTREVLEFMGETNHRPFIAALSNPTSHAECTIEEAAAATNGRCLFSAGSPFEDVEHSGRIVAGNQGNNFYIFPGLGLAVIVGQCGSVSDGMLRASAEALPKMLSQEQLDAGRLYPGIKHIRKISHFVACEVLRQAAKEGLVRRSKCLEELERGDDALADFVRREMYVPEYKPLVYVNRY